MVIGQGKSQTATVLIVCAILMLAILFLLGLFAEGLVQRSIEERDLLQRPADAPRAIPATNPGIWFTADDYPPSALRANEQGRTVIALLVDQDGTPKRCRVTTSSGYADLDRQTCHVAMRRGTFKPLKHRHGDPDFAIWIGPIRWVIPTSSRLIRG